MFQYANKVRAGKMCICRIRGLEPFLISIFILSSGSVGAFCAPNKQTKKQATKQTNKQANRQTIISSGFSSFLPQSKSTLVPLLILTKIKKMKKHTNK